MVSSVISLPLRLSGDSAEGSGVVPQDESRPLFDIDELEGEVTVEVVDTRGVVPFFSVKGVGPA